ncbi:hypothetical protein CR513_45082, partial [Mucuna pruriens]
MIQGKCCSLVIDGYSSLNVASQGLGENFVCKLYKDKITCNVALMEATNVLLRMPWQLDRRVTHDGITNKLSFIYKGNKATLKLLTHK